MDIFGIKGNWQISLAKGTGFEEPSMESRRAATWLWT